MWEVVVAMVEEDVPYPKGVEFMANGEEYLDGWVGAGGGEVKGGGVDFRVSRTLLGEIPEEIIGESGG
ncbi:hypothetical protein Tco_0852026 [Tanacetum coccineum]